MPYLTHYDNEGQGWQDTALVCLNGHMVNHSMKRDPEYNTKFCKKCGEKTISQCTHCGHEIQGNYHYPHVVAPGPETAPIFCHECGKAYPWTEKRLEAAKELIDMAENLSPTQKEDFGKAVGELVKEGPRTGLAAEKFKRYSKQAGKAIGEGVWKIVIDVASEAAKKILIPGP